jgi:hypothetical protein
VFKKKHLGTRVCFHPVTPDEKPFCQGQKTCKKGMAGLDWNNNRKTIAKQAAYTRFFPGPFDGRGKAIEGKRKPGPITGFISAI